MLFPLPSLWPFGYNGFVIGLIVGSAFSVKGEWEERAVDTPFGSPSAPFKMGTLGRLEVALLRRHGPEGKVPPHRINHRANIYAMKTLGVEAVVGVNSVGSLKEALSPGTLLVPHDFLCPWSVLTFFDEEAVHITPQLDEGLRRALIEAARRAGIEVWPRGIYVQTVGPRLETKAEIAMLKAFGDVVGMTMAHEATLCCELGLPYASLCSVDNYAHGIGDEPLSDEEIRRRARENSGRVEAVLEELRP